MNIVNGSIVSINGKELKVTGIYGAGAHTRYTLSDGSEVLDLHKTVEAGAARVVVPVVKKEYSARILPAVKDAEKAADPNH